MKVLFDRSLARGRYKFAVVVTAIIMMIPLGMVKMHDGILQLLSSGNWLASEEVMCSYESYLNPSFDNASFGSDRGYKIILAYIGAFLLNGLLVSLVVAWIQNRRERWEKGDLHYGKYALGKFSIVIGGNEMVPDLVRQLVCDKNQALDYVLVMTNRDVATLRKKFVSALGKMEKKVVIYYGERTSDEDLKLLRVSFAKEIYVIGEQLDIDQNGSHHDVKNMDCVQKIAALLKICPPDKKISCRVMFEYQSTFSVFQFAEVTDDISVYLDFRPFNYYETWAQKVFVNSELVPTEKSEYIPLEGTKGITVNDDDTVHLIVVGMSRMGIALAVEAAHIAHYPNFISKNKRTRITLIDSDARKTLDINYEESKLFESDIWYDPLSDNNSQSPYKPHETNDKRLYTLGDNYIDVEWQFIEGNLEMPTVQQYISNEAKMEHSRLTIAICFPKDNASLAASLYLPDVVYEVDSNVQQVLVYQPYGDAMRMSFKNDEKGSHKSYSLFAKLRAFGMMNKCYDIKAQHSIDKMLIETELAYNAEAGKQIPGRNKLRKRFGMSEAFKGKPAVAKQWSSYYSVSHMWTKLRSVNYDGISERLNDDEVALLSQVEHIRWNLEQLLMGYAPLCAEKFYDLKKKYEKGLMVQKPSDIVFEKLEKDIREILPEADYIEVVAWLNEWKAFDDTKEQLKANMEHADICSYDILKSIDKDSLSYDEVLVKALSRIYRNISNKND